MTKAELNEWFKHGRCVESRRHEDGGNVYEERIFEQNGELFLLNFCNDHPSEVWTDKGYIRGEYQPKKVTTTERTEVVTYTDYVDEKGKVIATMRKYTGEK